MKTKKKEAMMRKRYVQNLSMANFCKPYSKLNKIEINGLIPKGKGLLKLKEK